VAISQPLHALAACRRVFSSSPVSFL
jgi:hypothetical protein